MIDLALAIVFGHDHYISRDSGWCWFADPRAIRVGRDIVAGGVTSTGDIVVNRYDPVKKETQVVTLAKNLEKDDHDNPSFLRLPDRTLLAFYSKHTGADMFMARTLRPDDVSEWTKPRPISPNDASKVSGQGVSNGYCYPNPQMLSKEKNRIYLFWRGMNWKPTLSWSDDKGENWSKGRVLVSPEDESPSNRPYMKVSGDGEKAIHMAFTDGHPRNEPTNSIYYMRMEGGRLLRADNSVVGRLDHLPVRPKDADIVYDGRAEGVRSWIWDVTQDSKGRPFIVYTRLPKEDQHIYRYAWWDGRRWVDRKIVDGGGWFPKTPEGKTEPEPHYSGGLALDPIDPRFVYVSRPINGRFEIERWFTEDGGDTWSHVAITGNSKHDSVRPFVLKGDGKQPGPRVLWSNVNKYVHYTDFAGTIQAADEDLRPFNAFETRRTMDAVRRWVRSNPSTYTKTEWMLAPLYSGVLDYAELSGDRSARDWVRDIAQKNGWKLGPRPFMADDQAVGQAYLQLFRESKNPLEIAAVRAYADALLQQPNDESLEWKNGIHNREWAWCDSLFMAPPTLAMLAKETGDSRYLDLCTKLWKKTSDYLYDPKESLFYRDSRYFQPREANGAKVFWSRGNGWVLAGLARVLHNMPADHRDRAWMESQFKAMAKRIAGLQTPDGTWHASLLDPASYPAKETSGTGFYCYAMAWGVRSGLLPSSEFRPVVDRAFAALTRCIDPNGRLGWVQPIGQDPKLVKFSDTDSYGVGAFLLAAGEVSKLGGRD